SSVTNDRRVVELSPGGKMRRREPLPGARLCPMASHEQLGTDQKWAPSGSARSRGETPRAELDRAIESVREKAREFARLPAKEKAALLRSTLPLLASTARTWVDAACRAKRISATQPISGEEWLGGPMVTARNMRLLVLSLEEIATKGRPSLGRSARV